VCRQSLVGGGDGHHPSDGWLLYLLLGFIGEEYVRIVDGLNL
jgi:hypothetical protein